MGDNTTENNSATMKPKPDNNQLEANATDTSKSVKTDAKSNDITDKKDAEVNNTKDSDTVESKSVEPTAKPTLKISEEASKDNTDESCNILQLDTTDNLDSYLVTPKTETAATKDLNPPSGSNPAETNTNVKKESSEGTFVTEKDSNNEATKSVEHEKNKNKEPKNNETNALGGTESDKTPKELPSGVDETCKDQEGPKQKEDEINKDNCKVNEKPTQNKPAKENPRVIWVSNIARSTKASELKIHLSKFGKVNTAKIVTDGKFYYGYVIMEKIEEVNNCIKNLDNTYFEGCKITVCNKGPETIKSSKINNAKVSTTEEGRKSDINSKEGSKSEIKRKASPKIRNKSPESRRHRSATIRERQLTQKNYADERRREERRFLERQKEKEREERRRSELFDKLREARKKLDEERDAFEKEKLALVRLQKRIAEEERSKLKREKDNLKKEYRNLEAGLKRRKSDDERDSDHKKLPKIDIIETDRKKTFRESGWRFVDKEVPKIIPSKVNNDFKYKRDYVPSKLNKNMEDKTFRNAPPPPKLTEDYDYGRRDKFGNEDSQFSYRRINYMERGHRPDIIDRRDDRKGNTFGDHRDKKQMEKPIPRYQTEYMDRNSDTRKIKYPSTIGSFASDKPDFSGNKHLNKPESGRALQSYPPVDFHGSGKSANWGKSVGGPTVHSTVYVDHWKQESAVCPPTQRYNQFPNTCVYGGPPGTSVYYPQDQQRYDAYHGRKY